jgi:hypothetical protein
MLDGHDGALNLGENGVPAVPIFYMVASVEVKQIKEVTPATRVQI